MPRHEFLSNSINSTGLLRQLSLFPPTGRYLLAFSGGLDSTVLLHLLASIKDQIDAEVVAIHIDHGLQQQSPQWSHHCVDRCRQLDISLETLSLSLQPAPGESVEAQAREARYAAMQQLMRPGDILLTAHHRDDQAETLLLNLMRGSGVRGLAAMPVIRPFAEGWLARPLLEISRAEIEAYALHNKLTWVDDPSNALMDFNRNYLRHEILPLLTQRWPAAAASIADSASHLAESGELLDGECAKLLSGMLAAPGQLHLEPLLQQPHAWQKMLLRHWLQQLGLPPPPKKRLTGFVQQLKADSQRVPLISWNGAELRRYNHLLYAGKCLPPHDAATAIEWCTQQPLKLPSQLGDLQLLEGAQQHLQVRFRRAGDAMRWRSHQRTLKAIFRQLEIPPWQRDRIPLIIEDSVIIAIADLAYADDATLRLNWKRQVLS
ncbi:MAG: tRNA lysidine(34) synthetase TilS [Pseudomonadota bacterium]|nr:tRNA lysidine(34) synthetase TilS [Pseudomonadota bacterium]